MMFAIFGDIHGNLEALHAVLKDATSMGCERFACTGDLAVGFSNPQSCIEIVRNLECLCIKGDSDETLSDNSPLNALNPTARRILQWNRDQLSDDEKAWLRDLPLVENIDEFTLVHATLDTPGGWTYVVSKFDAVSSFDYQFNQVCFFGHTHCPKFYIEDDVVKIHKGTQITVEQGNRYFVNVGSVGLPRDGDWRACYAIYDLEKSTITIRRVTYDHETARRKILNLGFPPMLGFETMIPESNESST